MLRLPKLEEKLFQLGFMDHETYRLGIFRQKIQTHPQAMLMHSWDSYVRSANSLKGKTVNEFYPEELDRDRESLAPNQNICMSGYSLKESETRTLCFLCCIFKKPSCGDPNW